MITNILAGLGRDLLKQAFPSVYERVANRTISSTNPLSNDRDKPPLIKSIDALHTMVKQSNEIATDSLEAQLIQNDVLGKIQASGLGTHASAGILDWLEKFMPKGVNSALGIGAEVVGGGIAAKQVTRMIRGKNGRYMSAKQAAANPEQVAVDTAKVTPKNALGGRVGRVVRSGNKLMRFSPIMTGALGAYDAYLEDGSLAKAGTVGVGTGLGAWGGGALGASIGQALIPIPLLGALIGGFVGGYAGSWLGNKTATVGYDLITGHPTDKGGSLQAQLIRYQAGDILSLKAQEIIISALEIQGLAQQKAKSPVFRPGITPGNYTNPDIKNHGTVTYGNGNPRTGGPTKYNPDQKPDIDYTGPGTGAYDSTTAKANFMQPGTQYGNPGENIVQVETEGGHKFNINSASAPAFKRFIESAEKAGMPLGNIGGYSPRPGGIAGSGRMSQHSMGNAMDIGSQSARDVISPATRQWIESHPNQFRKMLNESGMISGGDWRNPDLGHIEWSGRKPWLEDEQGKTLAIPDQKIPEQPTQATIQPQQTKPPPGPLSYDVDFPQAIKAIRAKYPASAMVGDDYIKTQMIAELKKNNPNLQIHGNRLTGDSAEMVKLRQGIQDNLGEDPSNYLKPVAEPKVVPVPIPAQNPEVQRLRTEKNKLHKELKRAKKDIKKDTSNKHDDADEHHIEEPKDTTRSDRAIWNINPQLHDDKHPQ
jgi:hypothetical protein